MSELPKGWAEISCGDTFTQIPTSKIKVKSKDTKGAGEFPVIDQGANFIAGYFDDEQCVIKVEKPVCVFGDHTRVVKWVDFNFVPGADGTKVLVPNDYLYEKFFFYQLKNAEIKDRGYSRHFKYLKETMFRVAPLNEQIRIADKLDSILAKVNKAQSRLDKIPTILKRFRQSVLIAATSGDLTKEWREENDITLSGWEETVFSELSREITVGFVGKMSDKYQSEGVKFLRSQNVRAFRFDSKNLLYISTEFHEKIYKSRLEAGDLAVVRSGAPGTTCVIPNDLGDANCSDLVIVRPNEKLIPEFGCIYMNSSVAQKNVKDNQVGVAQQHFNVGSMKLMPILLPTKAEQSEIVRRVHSLFALAEAVEKNYRDSNVKVYRLTQSLLAKAFRGELVPQDSNDESADKLLKRIRKSVTDKPKKKPSPNIKKEKVEEVKGSDSDGNSSKANLTSEASDTNDTLRAKYQAEIHKAQISLQGATFSVEQFSSLTEFKGGYVELKKLIMNLLKGVPGINEPLFEVESWDAKSGDYALRLVKS
ncbi:restriction endonuclease subunit S [Pseudoalteromonas sp. SG43-1]|uniref:restriction endonuclease subunit S n=1 Tax=Pseudoalteromonas sp. SG43-1 TaxID=2760971 RepID=UPI0016022C3C|nr:restriction endonuclease subunit S [Pseudoalteromonas sp. SG43-1]MBB1453270.1 restriction endonuclease subunit S [Pseudoalteromonas sp. SG43-1]